MKEIFDHEEERNPIVPQVAQDIDNHEDSEKLQLMEMRAMIQQQVQGDDGNPEDFIKNLRRKVDRTNASSSTRHGQEEKLITMLQ